MELHPPAVRTGKSNSRVIPYDRYLWECLLEGQRADRIAAKVASHCSRLLQTQT